MQPTIFPLSEYQRIAQTLNVHPSETKDRYGYYETEQHTIDGFLIALFNAGLLKNKTNVIDVGCGLCTTLFNLYTQSQHRLLSSLSFKFYGIEYDRDTATIFEKELLQFFEGNLTFSIGEAEDLDYSNYDFIYLYSPMKLSGMHKLYDKMFSEINSGTVVYDNYMFGQGLDNIISEKSIANNLIAKELIFGDKLHTVWIKS